MTLEEYLRQQGYVYRPENRVETDGGMSGNFGGYGRYRDVEGDIEGTTKQVFDEIERSETARYYEDPSRFTATRDTKFGQGINTFNEGNENQKRILDQINTGQLYISPRLVAGRVLGEPEAGGEGYREETVYDLRDSRTGEPVQQQVKAIDASKGIFNIVADDPNSSGFFNNYVSTDPKGFVNPVVSEQQSQYQSKKNSSADFYRNAGLGLLSMTGLAFPGLGEALGAATGLGTVGGNIALNTGINAIKQGVSGQFNPLALATSAALSYGMGGAGGEGADPLTADDLYTGQAMQNLANSSVPPLTDLYTNLDLGGLDTPIQNTDQGTYQMGQGTSLSQDAMTNRLNPFYSTANPEVSANLNTVSNLVGGGADSNIGALDQLSGNYLLPLSGAGIGGTELGSVGSIIGSGKGLGQQTLAQILAPTGLSGLTVKDLESDKTMYKTTDTSPLTKPKLLSNILKSSLPQALRSAQESQQQSNMANILRGTQMAQTALPSIYKQQNPFNFGQQNQPVQDTTALANLLRTA